MPALPPAFFSSSSLLSRLELSDTRVYEPQIRALLGTALHFFQGTCSSIEEWGVASAGEGGAGFFLFFFFFITPGLELSDTKVYEP